MVYIFIGDSLGYYHVGEASVDYKHAFKYCKTGGFNIPRGETRGELRNLTKYMKKFNISVAWLSITRSNLDIGK